MSDPTLRTLNDSGFPLQVPVHRAVEEGKDSHRWSVRYIEQAWASAAESRSGFLDLVLVSRHGTGYLTIECKRPRDAEWIFLHSDGQAQRRAHAQVWFSLYRAGAMAHFGWAHVTADPTCPEAQFCAVRGQSAAEEITLLEKSASELVLATECLAMEHKDYHSGRHQDFKAFSCAIFTTAKLKVARFDPEQISLADGTLSADSFDEVPYLRFRKQFGVHGSALTPQQYGDRSDVAYLKESTVFVVNAESISLFLEEFHIRDSSLQPYFSAA